MTRRRSIFRAPRLSETVRIGPFRFGVSVPLGQGQTYLRAGTRTGRRSWTSISVPVGARKAHKRPAVRPAAKITEPQWPKPDRKRIAELDREINGDNLPEWLRQ